METWYVIHRIKFHQQNAHVCMSSRQQGRDRLVLVCSSRVYRESIQSSGTICLLAFDDVDLRWLYGCFQKLWYPQIINLNRVFLYKPSILGYPYFWKHPYTHSCFLSSLTSSLLTLILDWLVDHIRFAMWWIMSYAKWKSGMAVTSIWVKCNSLISNMLEFGKGNAFKNDQTRRSTGVDQPFPNEKLECRRWSWWKVCQDELFPEVTCT